MDFSDIAAYKDNLVPKFIQKIIKNPKFQGFMSKFPSFPKVLNSDSFSGVIEKLKTINTVSDFQKIMAFLVSENIKATSDSFTYSGIENLPQDKGAILLSSHRSIGLDAAYTNFAFYKEGMSTVYNGCGDNIMKTSWLGHLIRINKGFVVKREVSDIEMKLREISKLSSYIKNLIYEQKSVWIAHRGGRSKNGIDETDSVVLAMLYKESGFQSWGEWSKHTALIPLSISWEISPCDLVLADELSQPHFKKPMHRDFADILLEINSPKGRVHLSFGKPIQGEKRKDIVALTDAAIQSNYRLWDANWMAYTMQEEILPADREYILSHIDTERAYKVLDRGLVLQPQQRSIFYDIYANPVRSALRHASNIEEILY